ncbi:PREDICTED: uncharacterized protein LOC108965231 [Bactrocera latifrons]|uniref:Uncharacterized protein n=1 Tax=Bactrocera latifrons TaxID=174628 RepID=A0A0K8UNW2_BACLA|nr:PREDICTED: uncharacterized protein LOC108965231 [Bactrocera latifrons]
MDTVTLNNANKESNGISRKANDEDTGFTSCGTHLDVKGRKLTVRMLRMNLGTLVTISPQGNEYINEMGVACPAICAGASSSSTTLFGPEYASNSQRLADLWSKRYKRQFIVSCNVQTNDIDGASIEKALSDWICANV